MATCLVFERLCMQVLVRGLVTVAAGSAAELRPSTALYLTVRPPGRYPPVAAIRVPASELTFPFSYAITAADVYPEAPPPAVWARDTLVVRACEQGQRF